MKGILIGLDHGSRRIGIAVSDEGQEFVWPRPIIPTQSAHAILQEMISDLNPVGIVIGMPFMLDGTEGEQCNAVRHFILELEAYYNSDIFIIDERMSSKIAKSLYHTENDSYAAITILEIFIRQRQQING
jgi:putative holliday junction resolvase